VCHVERVLLVKLRRKNFRKFVKSALEGQRLHRCRSQLIYRLLGLLRKLTDGMLFSFLNFPLNLLVCKTHPVIYGVKIIAEYLPSTILSHTLTHSVLQENVTFCFHLPPDYAIDVSLCV
jgi:hypothetical protein